MNPDEGADRLQAFIDQWPVGMQFTTRGIQVGAGIPDLLLAEQAAAQLRDQGLLVMESIGATHLWRRCEPASAPDPVEVAPEANKIRPIVLPAVSSPTNPVQTAPL
jgi:hypothetical protein